VLAELPRHLRDTWWLALGPGVEVAAQHAPERVIALLERYWTTRDWRCLSRLLNADPARTLALYLVPGRQAQLAGLLQRGTVRRRLAALTDAQLGELGRAVRDQETALANLLRSVPPSRRNAVFTAATAGVDLSQAIHSEYLLTALPQHRRVAEARRMLGLRAIAEVPHRTLEITAFLPYGEAEPTLRAATRRSEGLDRANGYLHLIACAGRGQDIEAEVRARAAERAPRGTQITVRREKSEGGDPRIVAEVRDNAGDLRSESHLGTGHTEIVRLLEARVGGQAGPAA
jgi:hypothetical protein